MTDDEIERIKAKIEEDNRAIAALENKRNGEFFVKTGFKYKLTKYHLKTIK